MFGKPSRRAVIAGALAGATTPFVQPAAASGASSPGPLLAPRPPMGWNSWNSFATTITEAQARETAAIMAAKLLPFGYDVFTVDIQWYEPTASGYDYHAEARPTLDAHAGCCPRQIAFPPARAAKASRRLPPMCMGWA